MNNEEKALERMIEAKNYTDWLFESAKPYLKGKVLEIGCGIGNMTKLLIREKIDLTASDNNENYIQDIKTVYDGLNAFCFDISKGALENKADSFDTILCFNVLEHIEDDITALKNINKFLRSEGKLILFVPANPWLFNSLDKEVNHYRRYSKSSLIKKVRDAGFIIKEQRKVNFLGVFGWFFYGHILKKKILSKTGISIFDKISPMLFKLEKIIQPPIGLSLWLVCEKKSTLKK